MGLFHQLFFGGKKCYRCGDCSRKTTHLIRAKYSWRRQKSQKRVSNGVTDLPANG